MKISIHGTVIAALALGGTWFAGTALADAPAKANDTKPAAVTPAAAVTTMAAKVLVQGVTHGGLHAVSTFPGPGKGITGVIAQAANGHKMLAWMIDDRFLAPGPLLAADGTNLTMQAAQTQGLMPKPMAAGAVAKAAMAAPGFTIGKSGPMIAAFVDPNCIFCHLLWGALQPDVQAGKVRVKIVPVGFLKPGSVAKATTIMMQKNPAQGWAYNEQHFRVHAEEGGTVPVKPLNPKIRAEIAANTRLLAKTGAVATPTVVICEDHAKTPTVLHGVPRGALRSLLTSAGSLEGNGTCAAG